MRSIILATSLITLLTHSLVSAAPVVEARQSISLCVDAAGTATCSAQIQLCVNTFYFTFMTSHCAKTCGRCTPTTCEDSSSSCSVRTFSNSNTQSNPLI
ncbi:hypothetical protein BKA70DRAFT_7798 [Coprinopsis sp. MPI-PUGE-AT-0042]|nr:hypothetical protein BKA70DRAFT_7798 [Coprinopsis sp. MPI-PUGE-AT-0042]